MVTVAPGRTAPCSSVTVPRAVAIEVCAHPAAVVPSTIRPAATATECLRSFSMAPPGDDKCARRGGRAAGLYVRVGPLDSNFLRRIGYEHAAARHDVLSLGGHGY